jgi:hypothetical protein
MRAVAPIAGRVSPAADHPLRVTHRGREGATVEREQDLRRT